MATRSGLSRSPPPSACSPLPGLSRPAALRRGEAAPPADGEEGMAAREARGSGAVKEDPGRSGVIEYWDQNQEQFQLAGVAAYRTTIEPKGLLLPTTPTPLASSTSSKLRVPGCPETFQSFQQSEPREEERRGESLRDQHQRVHRFREGDVIALPAGVTTWFYNDGETPVVAVTVADSGNNANQLDQTLRRFELAASPERRESSEGEEAFSGNVFRGLNPETIRKLQGHDDRRGNIVRVERGLQFVRPERRQERQEEEEEEEERRRRRTRGPNERTSQPDRADVYSREAGSVTSLNSQKLPILRQNAHYAPHWNINAHSILYLRPRGAAGQIVVIPQNFVVAAQAGSEGFEWVSFKTEDFPLVSPLAGKASVFRGLPEGVIANSYRLSDEEARRVKHGRGEEFLVFRPRRKVVESPLLERAAEDLAVLIRAESAPFVVVFLVRNKTNNGRCFTCPKSLPSISPRDDRRTAQSLTAGQSLGQVHCLNMKGSS
ncbi:unnamed protein product [Spirodela intermedia]|uniref:Cupin type-1 domain-containing protein n=1 Tax=Spirodela intermedia TaxID=51605 RepID=A0A7I8JSL2_SPIIN|nr:unnamed protein product [Spirodela intermedia]CAA6673187.1 unnamed protein product [Spirodela intermedia]